MKKLSNIFAVVALTLLLLAPTVSASAEEQKDLFKDPGEGIHLLGNGEWDRIDTDTMITTYTESTPVHSLNGDGVKACFNVVSGSYDVEGRYFRVTLMEDDKYLNDDYSNFNTESYTGYSDGTCAVYSGVGGDPGDKELYLVIGDNDSNRKKWK